MKERDMQAMSLKYLKLRPKLRAFRIPDEVYLVLRLAAEGAKIPKHLGMRARGALAGWPDELILKGDASCPYALCMIRENKTVTGRLTEGQEKLFAELKEKGIPYLVCRGMDESTATTDEFNSWAIGVANDPK